MTRREVIAMAPLAAAAAQGGGAARLPIKKGVLLSMFPKTMPIAERFTIAKAVGFDHMECNTSEDPKEAEEIRGASQKSGVPVHSVMNSAHWQYPLSASDPAVVEKSMQGMRTSIENAKLWGADTVLLVPAVVNAETTYKQAWDRSRVQIQKLIPIAEKAKIVIGVENVWNKFLLSPLEFAAYVDSFKTPWVRAYFDVGNVLLFGYPQDWLRTLGKRIVKVHFKDFRFKDRHAEFVPLREGEIDWKEIHKALGEIGYKGTATVEVRGGGEAELREISRRVDLILQGA